MNHSLHHRGREADIPTVVRPVLVGLIVTLLATSLAGCFVTGSVYPVPNAAVPSPPPAGLKEVLLEPEGGPTVVCWWHHDESLADSAPIVLFLHGNGENLETMRLSGTFGRLVELKAHVLALDYPGYGRSGGAPSERTLAAACDAALAWMSSQYPKSRRVVCGWSLGAAAAIGTAARNSTMVEGLVAMSAWTTLVDVGARFYPKFLVKLLVRDRYNSLESMAKIKAPILLIHGRNDRVIPFSQGEKLKMNAPSLQRWVPLSRTEHNDLLDNPIVWAEIRNFLRGLPPKGGAARRQHTSTRIL